MPTYSIVAPDGNTYVTEGPEGATPQQVRDVILRAHPNAGKPPAPAEDKPYAGFGGSFKDAFTTLGLADEYAAFQANPTEETRDAFLKAGESKYKTVGFGEGQDWEAFKEVLGGSLGAMALPVAAGAAAAIPAGLGTAAATAATVAGAPAAPVTGLISAGTAGKAGYSAVAAPQYFLQNALRQAGEQKAAGLAPEDFSFGDAALAAAGQTGLDVLEFSVLGKMFRAFPILRSLAGRESSRIGESVAEAAANNTLKSVGGGVAKGVAGGVAFEVPQEIAQSALERWQAGLSLDDDSAMEEYKQSAYGALALAPLFGGAGGAGAAIQHNARVRANTPEPATEDGTTPIEDDIEAFTANPSKERYDALVSRYVNQYGFPEGEAIKAAQAALEMADARQQEAAEAAAKLPTPEGDVGVTPTPGAAGQTTGDSTTSYVAPKVDRTTAEQRVTETFDSAAYDFTEDGEPLSVAAREAAVQMVVDGQDPYDAVGRAVEAEREGTLAPAPETTLEDLHNALNAKGIKWDDNPAFMKQTKALYGVERLDQLDAKQRANYVASLDAPTETATQQGGAGGATTTVEQIQAGKTVKDRISLANVALGDHLTTNALTYSHVDPVVMTAATNVAAQRVANKKLKNDVDPVATLNKVLAEKGVSITPIPPVFEGADTLIPNAPLGTVLSTAGGNYEVTVGDNKVVTGLSDAQFTQETAQDFANTVNPPPDADINLAAAPPGVGGPTSVTTDQNRAVGAAQLPNPGTDISAALAGGVVPTVDVPSRNPLEVDAKPRFDLEAYRKTNEAEDAARKVEEEAQAEQEKARIAGIAKRYDRTRQDVNANNPSTFSRMDWFAAAGLHELEAAGEYYDGLAPSERMQQRMQLARDAGIVEEGKSPPQVQTVLRKPWAELSPEQRTTLAEGFGVSEAGVAARKKRVNRPWAELTPEEQAALTSYIDNEPTGDTSAGKTATNAVVEEALVVDEALAARKAFGKALEEARSGAKITNEEYVSIRDSTGDQPKLLAAALDKKRVADDALVAENTKAKERHERAQMKLPASKRKPFVPKVGLAATASQAEGIGADPAPEEAARWQQLVEGKSLAEVADVLAAHGSPLTRLIAKRVAFLIRAMERLGVEFSFNVAHVDDSIPGVLVGARGVAIRTDNDMRVAVWVPGADVTGRVGTSEHILLHELIHAVTLSAANVGMYDRFANTALGVAVRDLIAVRKAIVGHFNKRAAEAEAGGRPLTEFEQAIFDERANYLQDKDEVLAWTMTDPHMRAYLEAIPYKGKSSLWSGFVRAVRILLGLSPAADTALSEVLRVGDILLSTNPKAVRNYISELFPDKPAGGTAAAVEETANQAMAAAANASTTAEVAASIQAGANARTYNPFRGPLNRLMASASATHLKRLLGGIPTSGIVEHFKRVKVGDKWADFPELEQFNEEIDQLARGMKSKMVRAFTRMAKRYSKFVSEFGSRVIAAAMHNARAASFDVSTFNSLGDAYKNDPLMDYLTRALAQRNLSAEQTASFTAQRKKRIGEITKVWGNWVALGKQEGGQALYREVQQYYKDMYNLTRSALNANIRTRDIGEEYQDRLIEAATLDREKNPDYPDVPAELLPNVYFPYKRYGKFWARVTSKAKKDKKREFHTFESAAERDRFVETRATQLGIKDKAKDSGYFPIGNDISDLQAQNDFTANSKMLKAMFEIVDKATFKDTKGDALEGDALELAIKKLKDSLYQTYLLTLPERSIRKQFIHAEGIPGYSEDVMRNFTTTATAYANQLPKIKYGALLDRKTEEARGRVEGWPSDIRAKMETVISELSGRAYYTLNPPDQSGFVTFVNNAAFLFLLSSAATALVQTTSIPMRVLPNLVSRYGYKETFFMLAKYAPGWNTVGITETLPDGTVLHTAPTFVNAKLQGKKPVNGLDIAGAAKYMQDHDAFEENAVHATMENRKSEVSTSESVGRKAFAATMKALTASFSMAERMSREMTGLMAYELEFNKLVKGGMEAKAAHDMAAKSAVKSVHDTLGNYSAYERPRYLKGDLARFVMLFKMYAVNTTMFFVRNTKTILRNDPNITAKERVAAAHELAGVLLMSGVFSGMTGMPLYTTICAVIDALSDGDDDDDDDGVKDPYAASSADWRFRHLWLPRHFGAITLPGLDGKQHSLSSIAERGLVSELSGVNIASRTAYDNMWFRQGRPGDNMTETLQNYLFDNFSPGLSVGFNMVGAVEDWSKGDIIRGFEKISPALIKGGFTATRLGTEGSRTRAGDLMVDKEDIESFPLLMQVAGFQPTEVATAQQDRIKADKLYKRKEDEREQLVREFTRARYGYDSTQEEILSAYEAMQEFSRKNAGDLDLIITADVLENSARSYLQRKNLTVNGRYVAPGQENFLRSERKEAQ